MKLTYLEYLFLDIFSTIEPRKINSLYHILTGKRTISVMLQTLRYRLTAYFAVFPKLNLTNFQERIFYFLKLGLLLEVEDNYLLTEKGKKTLEDFFLTHIRNENIYQMNYCAVLPIFKRRLLFLIQVLSESAHENNQYFPIQSRVSEQVWLKQFIRTTEIEKKVLSQQFGKELFLLLEKTPAINQELFVHQLEGNNKIRQTSGQVALEVGWEETEVIIKWQQDWLQIITYLVKNSTDLPIIAKIFQEIVENGGLCSKSTEESYFLWSSGKSLAEIATIRRLKISTINDHISEMAIMYPSFPFEKILSPEQVQYIEQRTKSNKPIHYEEIQEKFPELPFFENRLMQIMGEVDNLWSNKN